MNKSKQKGTAAESAVVKTMNANGWEAVERRALQGALDKGDIAGLPRVVIEVKDQNALSFGPWLKEAQVERDNAQADIGVVWAKRRGFTDASKWFVVMDGETFMKMLKEGGR